MKFSDAVYKRINELANENNLTLSQWAVKSGMTPSTLYDINVKKSKIPNLATIKRLCDGLNITLSFFFDVDYIDNSQYE